jgi:hypothetical protein
VYGTSEEPFHDTRWSLLKKRVNFAWRELLARRTDRTPAAAAPAAPEKPAFEAGSGDGLVVISTPRTQ